MCLSTVYNIEKRPENKVLENVMLISSKGGIVTLTDILGREAQIEGEVVSADLTAGFVVVAPRT